MERIQFKTLSEMSDLGVYITFKTKIIGVDYEIYEYLRGECTSYFYKMSDYGK
jgi:hypothetical protein